MAAFSHGPKPKGYLFDMNTTIYTPAFEKQNTTYLGVAHGSDVPFVFDTVPTFATATQAQKQLAGAMAASWAAFAGSRKVESGELAVEGWKGNGTGFEVRAMGGPNAGMSGIGEDGEGVLESEDLVRRCAFWNEERGAGSVAEIDEGRFSSQTSRFQTLIMKMEHIKSVNTYHS